MKKSVMYSINYKFIFCLLIIFWSGIAVAQDPTNGLKPVDKSDPNYDVMNTAMTRWVSPDNSRPITYNEWRAQKGDIGPFRIERVDRFENKNDQKGVEFYVIVNTTLYNQVQASVDQYMMDLIGEGYDAELYTSLGGTPENLRAFLQGGYADGLLGCILIGDLPVPWFETDFGDPPEHAEFPIDLFYMDLDGVFTDTDYDGVYDSHTGDLYPEIYVGRLTASPLTLDGANEVDLIENYFRKDHLYRSDLLPANNRSLVYIDDDWAPGGSWNLNVGLAYRNRTFIRDKWVTWSDDYKSRLPIDYENLLVCVHSWPQGHGFKHPDEQWSWTYNSEIKAIQPTAHFYNLFACSNARYVEPDYCAGWYVFNQDHGLAAVGSAKTGSMLYFEDYYQPFGQGAEIGLAFKDWFYQRAIGGFDESEITWFYGMTLIGDPTLKIQNKLNGGVLQFDNGTASYMTPLPHSAAVDLYNVRFTTAAECTLSSVSVTGYLSDTPIRMYIWNSDGTYPTTIIDSVDIIDGDLSYIDLYDKQLWFKGDEDFHIGFTSLVPTPLDSQWFYMDNGVPEQNRSGLYNGSNWQTLHEAWGADYNFLIQVEYCTAPEPVVHVTTTSLPDAGGGMSYSATVDVEGGIAPYSWDITSGGLPDGLHLEASSGTIQGTSSSLGTFPFTIRAVDSDSPSKEDVQHLSITVLRTCGDANDDGTLNIFDITFLITYLYLEGPAPDPIDMGDANGDDTINIFDITYLITYLYIDGPPPNCD
jgi:hypothetical protein